MYHHGFSDKGSIRLVWDVQHDSPGYLISNKGSRSPLFQHYWSHMVRLHRWPSRNRGSHLKELGATGAVDGKGWTTWWPWKDGAQLIRPSILLLNQILRRSLCFLCSYCYKQQRNHLDDDFSGRSFGHILTHILTHLCPWPRSCSQRSATHCWAPRIVDRSWEFPPPATPEPSGRNEIKWIWDRYEWILHILYRSGSPKSPKTTCWYGGFPK